MIIPKGYPVRLFVVTKSKGDLKISQHVYKFSQNDYYLGESISRSDRFEIKIISQIDFEQYKDVLMEVS